MRLAALALLLVCGAALADRIPDRAQQYRRDLVRYAQVYWGLDAPVSRFAAQIHQESAWRPDVSSAYADGLSQFTPSTATWIAEIYPEALSPAAPFSPKWAIQALVLYDRHLYRAIDGAATDCDHWAFVLSSYNGGRGWLNRDRRVTREAGDDPDRWWCHVARHSNRADWATRENRSYVRKILLRWEPLYRAAGWSRGPVCGH